MGSSVTEAFFPKVKDFLYFNVSAQSVLQQCENSKISEANLKKNSSE